MKEVRLPDQSPITPPPEEVPERTISPLEIWFLLVGIMTFLFVFFGFARYQEEGLPDDIGYLVMIYFGCCVLVPGIFAFLLGTICKDGKIPIR